MFFNEQEDTLEHILSADLRIRVSWTESACRTLASSVHLVREVGMPVRTLLLLPMKVGPCKYASFWL